MKAVKVFPEFLANFIGLIKQAAANKITERQPRKTTKRTRAYVVLMAHFAEKRREAKQKGQRYHSLMGEGQQSKVAPIGRPVVQAVKPGQTAKNKRRQQIKAVGGIRQFKKARRELRANGLTIG